MFGDIVSKTWEKWKLKCEKSRLKRQKWNRWLKKIHRRLISTTIYCVCFPTITGFTVSLATWIFIVFFHIMDYLLFGLSIRLLHTAKCVSCFKNPISSLQVLWFTKYIFNVNNSKKHHKKFHKWLYELELFFGNDKNWIKNYDFFC